MVVLPEMLLPAGTAGRAQEQSGCESCTIHVRGVGLAVSLEHPSQLLYPGNVPVATLRCGLRLGEEQLWVA